jgi:hypothetical protein
MSTAKQGIIDTAFELVYFVKTHEYPKELSTEFFELTQLMNKLETYTTQYKKELTKHETVAPAWPKIEIILEAEEARWEK